MLGPQLPRVFRGRVHHRQQRQWTSWALLKARGISVAGLRHPPPAALSWLVRDHVWRGLGHHWAESHLRAISHSVTLMRHQQSNRQPLSTSQSRREGRSPASGRALNLMGTKRRKGRLACALTKCHSWKQSEILGRQMLTRAHAIVRQTSGRKGRFAGWIPLRCKQMQSLTPVCNSNKDVPSQLAAQLPYPQSGCSQRLLRMHQASLRLDRRAARQTGMRVYQQRPSHYGWSVMHKWTRTKPAQCMAVHKAAIASWLLKLFLQRHRARAEMQRMSTAPIVRLLFWLIWTVTLRACNAELGQLHCHFQGSISFYAPQMRSSSSMCYLLKVELAGMK